jgi:hypothetical protein
VANISQRQRALLLDNRQSPRLDIRSGEGIFANIKLDESTKITGCRVFDISNTGMGILLPSVEAALVGKLAEQSGSVHVEIALTPDRAPHSVTCTLMRANHHGTQGQVLMGFRFSDSGKFESETPYFHLDKSFPLVGFVYKELFFKEKALLHVEAMRKDSWMLRLYDKELVLLPGMPLKIYLFLPHRHENDLCINSTVTRVLTDDPESLRAEVLVQAPSHKVQINLANYLVKMCKVTPSDVKEMGLEPSSVSDNFRFRYCKTEAQYEAVLKLRYEAYTQAGKVTKGSTPASMASPLDQLSRILTVYHGDTLVASITLTFPPDDHVVLDTEKALAGGYPSWFPPKADILELARFCIKEEYRKSHLALRVFQHVYKIFAQSGRKLIVSSTSDQLWPLYRAIGMKKAGVSYDHPVFKGLIHHLITIPIDCPTATRGLGPLKWNYLYREMTDYVERAGRVKPRGFYRLRLWAYRKIGDLLAFLWKDK